MQKVKVITLNVNGIRAAKKKGLFQWIVSQNPDYVCIQEVRAQEKDLELSYFNIDLVDSPLRGTYFFSKKPGYAGVAIFSKKKPTVWSLQRKTRWFFPLAQKNLWFFLRKDNHMFFFAKPNPSLFLCKQTSALSLQRKTLCFVCKEKQFALSLQRKNQSGQPDESLTRVHRLTPKN